MILLRVFIRLKRVEDKNISNSYLPNCLCFILIKYTTAQGMLIIYKIPKIDNDIHGVTNSEAKNT